MTNTNYRDLQATLKSHRSNGVTLQCKLTATMDILHAELLRIQSEPITSVTFTFDDGLCLGHSTPTAFDTYVMHNHHVSMPVAQLTGQFTPLVGMQSNGVYLIGDFYPACGITTTDSELTRESFNEARELYPTRITNNYLHYICLFLAYVYATIYIGCQVTRNLTTAIARYIIAKRLASIITATLHDMSFKPFYLDS